MKNPHPDKPDLRVQQLQIQANLHARLREVREFRKALVLAAREVHSILAPAQVAVAVRLSDGGANLQYTSTSNHRGWDLDLLASYLAGERPRIPPETVLAPIERRGRNWAVLALQDGGAPFTPAHRQLLFGVTQTLSDILEQIDRKRLDDIRRRLEKKIAERQEPKDIIYDILHGLRSLIRYDHSSALFLARTADGPFQLMAEQISWTKAKSRRIGMIWKIEQDLRAALHRGEPWRFEKGVDGWVGSGDPRLPASLERIPQPQTNRTSPPEAAMLCAPIVTPGESLGLLKISSRRAFLLQDHEANLVQEFLPLTSLAIQFYLRTETLEDRILQSERKHVLANLTRGISHDINNALGSVLPLVQQIRRDTERDVVQKEELEEDLRHIEGSLQTCRRIFGGMLNIARGTARPVGQANLRVAVDSAMSVVEERMNRRGIRVEIDLPDTIPEIEGGQNDLTQLFLNLCTNALDAMPKGGTLRVRATPHSDSMDVVVSDTGVGIPKESLERIFEPFYTTKPDGTGLGLLTCRSVVRDMGGSIDVESDRDKGTTFRLRLPRAMTKDER